MWSLPPRDRLEIVRIRQAELIAAARETRRTRTPSAARLAPERVRGLQLRLGRILIVVGRTLREDESPCPEPAHS
jgi:hypothetical protein